jgi:hypothetical protein
MGGGRLQRRSLPWSYFLLALGIAYLNAGPASGNPVPAPGTSYDHQIPLLGGLLALEVAIVSVFLAPKHFKLLLFAPTMLLVNCFTWAGLFIFQAVAGENASIFLGLVLGGK